MAAPPVPVATSSALSVFPPRARGCTFPGNGNADGIEGIDGDLLASEEVVDVHLLMDEGHVRAPQERPPSCVIMSVRGAIQMRFLTALYAGDVGGDLIQSGDGDGTWRERGCESIRGRVFRRWRRPEGHRR